jgi:hypothetical protein
MMPASESPRIPVHLLQGPPWASPRINRHTNDRVEAARDPKHSAAPLVGPLLPAGGGTGQGAADEIMEAAPKAAEAGSLVTTHRLPPVPARGAAVAQEAATAATAAEAAAAADRRLELFGNQMGRIALAVSAEVEHLYNASAAAAAAADDDDDVVAVISEFD